MKPNQKEQARWQGRSKGEKGLARQPAARRAAAHDRESGRHRQGVALEARAASERGNSIANRHAAGLRKNGNLAAKPDGNTPRHPPSALARLPAFLGSQASRS